MRCVQRYAAEEGLVNQEEEEEHRSMSMEFSRPPRRPASLATGSGPRDSPPSPRTVFEFVDASLRRRYRRAERGAPSEAPAQALSAAPGAGADGAGDPIELAFPAGGGLRAPLPMARAPPCPRGRDVSS